MRKLLVILALCMPSIVLASFENTERTLLHWFAEHPAEQGQEAIKVQTQKAGYVPNHGYDDVEWSKKVLEGTSCWVGHDPVPHALATVGAAVVTVGIWPASVLLVGGVTRVVEKVMQKTDVRKQEIEYLTFDSERNLQRYTTARLLMLVRGFRESRGQLDSEGSKALNELFKEWALWVGFPMSEEDTTTVSVDTLALRINNEIHKYKPVPAICN